MKAKNKSIAVQKATGDIEKKLNKTKKESEKNLNQVLSKTDPNFRIKVLQTKAQKAKAKLSKLRKEAYTSKVQMLKAKRNKQPVIAHE